MSILDDIFGPAPSAGAVSRPTLGELGERRREAIPTDAPRGIRNNNPGNIRVSAINWQGEVPGTDKEFETFATPEDGLRALETNLSAYRDKHGLKTVRGLINRWAPPTENNTSAYVNTVAQALGVNPDDEIDTTNPQVMQTLRDAIVQHENGQNPYRGSAASPRDSILASVFEGAAPGLSQPEQEPTWGDYGRALGRTAGDFLKAIPALGENLAGQAERNVAPEYQAYFTVAGDYMRDTRRSIKEWQDGLFANMTPEAQDRIAREYTTLDPNKTFWQGGPREMLSTLALQGTSQIGPTLGPLVSAVILQRVGVAASIATMFGAGEGIMSAGLTASQIAEDLDATPTEELRKTQRFAQLEQQVGEAEARRQYTQEVQGLVPVVTGAVVGYLAKKIGQPLDKVFGTGNGMPLLQRIGTGAAVEAAQEVPQSGAEQMMQNYARMAYDADTEMLGGVLESMVQGGVLGGLMGGGFAGVSGNGPRPTQQAVSRDIQAAIGATATQREAIPTQPQTTTPPVTDVPGVPPAAAPETTPELMGPPEQLDMWGQRRPALPDLIDDGGALPMAPEQPWDPNAQAALTPLPELSEPDVPGGAEVFGPEPRDVFAQKPPSRKIGKGFGEWIDESQQFEPLPGPEPKPGLSLVDDRPVAPEIQQALALDTVEFDQPPPAPAAPATAPEPDPTAGMSLAPAAPFDPNRNREPTFGQRSRTEHVGAGSAPVGGMATRGEYRVRQMTPDGQLLQSQLVPNRIEAQKLSRQWEKDGAVVQVFPSRRTFKNDQPPGAEPVRDLLAQAKAMQAGDPSRKGVYLSPASIKHLQQTGRLDEVLAAGVQIKNADSYGGVIVARDTATAQEISTALETAENADLDQIIGDVTGAGVNKPAGADTVVQRLDDDGNVVQERLVTDDQIRDTLEEFGDNSRVMPLEWALTRRDGLVQEDLTRAEGAAAERAAQATEPDKVRAAYNEQFQSPLMGDMAQRIAEQGGVEEDIAGRLVGWAAATRERDLNKRLDKAVPNPEEVSFQGREAMETKHEVTRQRRRAADLKQQREELAGKPTDTRSQKVRVRAAQRVLEKTEADYEAFKLYAAKSPERQRVLNERLTALAGAVEKARVRLAAVKAGTENEELATRLADIDAAINAIEGKKGLLKALQGTLDGAKGQRAKLAEEYKDLHQTLLHLAVRVEMARDENRQALLEAETAYDQHLAKMQTFLSMEGGYTRGEAMVKAAKRYSPKVAKVTRAQIAKAQAALDEQREDAEPAHERKVRKIEEAAQTSVETAAKRFDRAAKLHKGKFRSDARMKGEVKLFEYLDPTKGSSLVALEIEGLLRQWLSDYRYALRWNTPVDESERKAARRRDYVAAKTAMTVTSILSNIRGYHSGQVNQQKAAAYVALRVMDLLAMGKRYGIAAEMQIDGFWDAVGKSPEAFRDYLKGAVLQTRDTPALPPLTKEQLDAAGLADIDHYYVTALQVLGNASRETDGVRRELVAGIMDKVAERVKLSDKPMTIPQGVDDEGKKRRARVISPKKLLRETLTSSYGVRGADAMMDIKQLRELYLKGGEVRVFHNKKWATIKLEPVAKTLPTPQPLALAARKVERKVKVSTILRAVHALERGNFTTTTRAKTTGPLARTEEQWYDTAVLLNDIAPRDKVADPEHQERRKNVTDELKDALTTAEAFLTSTRTMAFQKKVGGGDRFGTAVGYYRWLIDFGHALVKAKVQSERGLQTMEHLTNDLATLASLPADEFVPHLSNLADTTFKEEGKRISRDIEGANAPSTRAEWLADSLERHAAAVRRHKRLMEIWPKDARFSYVKRILQQYSDRMVWAVGEVKRDNLAKAPAINRKVQPYRPTKSEELVVKEILKQWRTAKDLPYAERAKLFREWGVPADVAFNDFYMPLSQQLKAAGFFDFDKALDAEAKRHYTDEEFASFGLNRVEVTSEQGGARRATQFSSAEPKPHDPSGAGRRAKHLREMAGMSEEEAIGLNPTLRRWRHKFLDGKVKGVKHAFDELPPPEYGPATRVESDVMGKLRDRLLSRENRIVDILDGLRELGPDHPFAPIIDALRRLPPTLLSTKVGIIEGEGGLFSPEGPNPNEVQQMAHIGMETLRSAPPRQLLHTLLHETVHGATLGTLASSPDVREAWEALRKVTYDALKNHPDLGILYGNKDVYEFVSEVFSNPVLQQAMKQTRVHGVVGRLWARFKIAVMKLFGVDQQHDTLWDYALSLQPLTFSGDPYTDRMHQRLNGERRLAFTDAKAAGKELLTRLENAQHSASNKGGSMLLKALTMRQIEDTYRRHFGGKDGPMGQYFKAFFNRNSDVSKNLEVADVLSRDWTKLRETDGKAEQALSKLMTDATYFGIHPDAAFTPGVKNTPNGHLTEDSRADWQRLSSEYAALPQAAKDLYAAVREYYKTTTATEVKLMLLNALRASKLTEGDLNIDESSIDLTDVTKPEWLQKHLGYDVKAEKAKVDAAERRLEKALLSGTKEEQAQARKEWKALAADFDSVEDEIALIARMASLPTKMDGPYFPLMRFGDIAVSAERVLEQKTFDSADARAAYMKAKRADDPTLQFSWPDGPGFPLTVTETEFRLAETWTQAEKHYAEMVAEYGKGAVSRPQLKRALMTSGQTIGSNRALQTLLGKLEGNAAAQAAIRQFYIQSLSDRSFRKREAKRKNTRGVEGLKQHRTFAAYSKSAAYYMAQLRFGHLMADAKQEMQEFSEDFAKRGDERDITAMRMSEVVKEIETRDKQAASLVEPSDFVRHTVEAGQLYMLLSPSYWAINLMQPFVVTAPYLSAYATPAKAAKAMAYAQSLIVSPLLKRGIKSWGGLRAAMNRMEAEKAFTVMEDVEARIREQEGADSPLLKMLTDLKRESIIDLSFIAELRNVAEGEAQGLWSKVMDASRVMAHLTEVNNRIMTAVAAYNLAIEQGQPHENAVDFAKKTVVETQFDYSAANKARLFSHNDAWWKPMVFQFMQYVQHMYVLFIKHLRNVVKTPFGSAEWKVSAKIVGGLLATHAAVGGIVGVTAALPLKWAAGLLIMTLGGGDDEDRTWKNWVSGELWERWISEVISDMVGDGRASVALRKGVPAAFGADLSSRTAFLQTYMVDMNTKTAETFFGSALMSFGGPAFSLAGQGFDAMKLIGDRQYAKAGEKLLPKMARDVIRTGRFAEEGMVDNYGRTIKNASDLHPFDLFVQAVGITPTSVTETYDRNSKAKDRNVYVENMKAEIGRRFRLARTPEDMRRVNEEVAEFNRLFPTQRVNYASLVRSRLETFRAGLRIQQYGVDAGKKSYLYADDTYDVE